MKYMIEITIHLPRKEVLSLFQDESFMKQWQKGFESLEVISGTPGEVGSKSILKYNNNGKHSQIDETIIYKELPDRFDFTYEAKGVYNIARNTFVEKNNETIWIAEHEFQFKGLMKLLNLMKGSFVKQTSKDMNAFKEKAELQ